MAEFEYGIWQRQKHTKITFMKELRADFQF
jgi:hypothetical protein